MTQGVVNNDAGAARLLLNEKYPDLTALVNKKKRTGEEEEVLQALRKELAELAITALGCRVVDPEPEVVSDLEGD